MSEPIITTDTQVVPTVDVLPPMTPFVRRFLYGSIAWLATASAVAVIVFASVPAWTVPDWFLGASAGINGAWALLGFKAKGAVSNVKA